MMTLLSVQNKKGHLETLHLNPYKNDPIHMIFQIQDALFRFVSNMISNILYIERNKQILAYFAHTEIIRHLLTRSH